MSNLAIKEFKGQKIRIRPDDRYVCLTDMAKASGKRYPDWSRLDSTKSYLETLSGSVQIPTDQLIEVNESSGLNINRGTWGHPKVAIRFAQWCSDEFAVQVDFWVDELMTTGKVELNRVQPTELEVNQSRTEYLKSIQWLQDSGDIQLAQLLKSDFGNRVLASTQQQQLPGTAEVVQYEGVVDVALRLGFSVPKNYEATLGKYVKSKCSHLLIGQNNRYSTASQKQVPANMYPKGNSEVQEAVTDYCLSKSLTQRGINYLG